MAVAKILIVEDEALVARDIERLLEKQGYHVTGNALSGDEAISMVQETRPDLVLMDIKLRGALDGIEAAKRIRAETDIPVIFVTAHADAATLNRAKATSPAGYLLKPIDSGQLRISVDIALHLHDVERRARQQEQRFQSVVRTAPDGFVAMDLLGAIRDVNQAYCSLLGYEQEELLSMNWADLETSTAWKKLNKENKVSSARYESAHRAKAGHEIPVEVSVSILPEQELMFAFLRDITERKHISQQIEQLNVELEQQAAENQRLYHTERTNRHLAEILVEASRVVSSTLHIDDVLDLILEQVGYIVKNDVCNIVLIDGEQARVVRTHGYEAFDASSFIETFVFPLAGVPIRQHIIETREPVVVSDVRYDQRWRLDKERIWLRSYVAAPIFVQEQVIGLINVGISIPGFYSDEHGRWLAAFANHAALAFQNASLFERAEDAAEQMELLSHRLLNIQEGERRYLARELHDEVGQTLTAARISLQAIRNSQDPELIRKKVKESLEILELALNQVRSMSLDLRPSMLDDLGLLPTLRWYVDKESLWGEFKAEIQASPVAFPRMSGELELVCFRIVQEAITNIMRHARATYVTIELKHLNGDILLSIHDNGHGFDVKSALKRAGQGHSLGLLGMQERAALVNGELKITSHPGKGTTVHAILPFREETAPQERTI